MTELPDIADLLPQQPPMRLLDRLLAWSADGLEAEVAIGPATAFHHAGTGPGGVPAWVGLEYLAQAAAAWFGVAGDASAGIPRPGMLVACRRYESREAVFAEGSVLTVTARPASAPEASLVRFAGEIRRAGHVLATGELSVFMPAPAR